jgi:ABC-type dipeptide/oligopeptide/nickel transport system permease component
MVFLMLRFLPGDPALILAGEETAAEQVEQVHYQMGGALRGKLCRLPAPGKRNILKSDLKYLDLNII